MNTETLIELRKIPDSPGRTTKLTQLTTHSIHNNSKLITFETIQVGGQ